MSSKLTAGTGLTSAGQIDLVGRQLRSPVRPDVWIAGGISSGIDFSRFKSPKIVVQVPLPWNSYGVLFLASILVGTLVSGRRLGSLRLNVGADGCLSVNAPTV